MLITTVRIFDGPEIEAMVRELARVIEEFDHAVNVEALQRAEAAGKFLLSQYEDSLFSVVSYRSRASAQTAQTHRDRL